MRARRAIVVAAGLVTVVAAGAVYAERAALERAWTDYRWPRVQARARAMLELGLQHPNKFIRIDAAGLLARAEDPRGFGVLARALDDVNPVTRQSAALYLAPFEQRAVPLLEPLLHDPETLVRERTARALGHMKCAEAQAVLRQEWETGQSVGSSVLFEALWEIDPLLAMDLVLRELREPRRLTRVQALHTYVQNRWAYGRDVGADALTRLHANVFSMLQALRRTGALSPPEADAIDAYLDGYASGAALPEPLPQGLGLTPPYAPELRRMLSGTVPESGPADQEGAAQAVVDDTRSSVELLTALESADIPTRIAAALRLQHRPSARVLEAIDRHLTAGEPVDRVREPLVRALMQEAPARAVPHLIAAVTHERFHVRASAADMLRETVDPLFMPVYEVALQSEFEFVRAAAVAALVQIEDHPDRRRLLARALDDENAANQLRAAGAIVRP